MSSTTVTTWELKLKDLVMGPMTKLMNIASGTQKKIMGVQGSMDKMAKSAGAMGKDFGNSYSQLETRLQKLKTLQEQAFSIKHIENYQKAINKTQQEMDKITNVMNPKKSKWAEFKGGLSGMASQIPGVGGLVSMATNPYMLAATAAIAVGTATTKLSLDYETGMAKINATAQLPEKTLGKLKGRLLDIGGQSGGNFELMPGAYEKILSQTNKVNLSLDILETSVKGAKAGFTDIDTVAGALAQTMSVVGAQNTTANQVMDTLLKAKAVGAGEFKDFAQYLPPLIAAGNSLHVGFKDVAGLFSFMTAKGQSAADAAMLLQNAFTALQKKEVIKGLEGKGIKLFDTKGMRRNIADVFLEITKKTASFSDRKKTQFLMDIGLNDAQARSAFSVLTSEADKFKSIMGDVNSALGETDRQIAATANTARNWGDIGDQLKSIGVGLGDYLVPVIDSVLDGLIKMGQNIKAIFSGDWWANFFGGLDKKNAMLKQATVGAANATSMQLVNKKFGAYQAGESEELTKARNKALVNVQDIILKASSGDKKNIIDDKESKSEGKKESLLDKVNGGTDDSGSKSSLKGSGSGSGGRNLTQNLYITINIKKSTDIDDGKLKRKLTDIIVDAGRDGLVNIGV